MTDANLILGRLIPEYFPALFGPNGNEPLDRQASLTKFQQLADTVWFLTSLTDISHSSGYSRSIPF